MKKGIKIFVIITSIVIVLGGTSGFLAYYFLVNPMLFTPCTDRPFTYEPVELDRISSIAPLGNLNPPGHTYPTDHIYYFTNQTAFPDGFEIYAPGEILITQIDKVTYDPPQVAGVTTDYTIEFSVCSKVKGKFGHANNLSTYLSDLIGEFGAEYGDSEDSYEIDGRIYTKYVKNLRLKISAGQLLGRAGLGGSGYDFWLKDSRVKLEWVNSDISRSYANTVCPIAYFTDDLKNSQLALLKYWDGTPVDPSGYCGKIDFDVENTAQGVWAREGFGGHDAEEYGLALVYSNFNASKGAFSVGNAENPSWDKRTYYFNPEDSGYLNRNFSQVTYDNNVYYYICDYFGNGIDVYKVLLLKMTANNELLLQFVESTSPLTSNLQSLFDANNAVHYYR